MRKLTYAFLPYVVLIVLLIGLAYVPGYSAAPTAPSLHASSDGYYYYYYYTTVQAPVATLTAPAVVTCTDDLRIAASYDRNTGYLRFDGWRFTRSGMVTGYIDGDPVWDTGPTAPDGHVWGLLPISLSPGQHTVHLVDLPTGKQSCTVTISA